MDRKPLLASSGSEEEEEKDLQRHRAGLFYQAARRNFSVSFNQVARLIRHGNLQKLRDVLAKRDVQLTDSRGVTVLHVAAATNNPDVVDTLLCQKRCQALLDAADLDGVTPVMTALQAASYGTLDQLCARGADLTKPLLTTGKTLLHLAALASDATAARIVLGYNSSPDFVNAVDHSDSRGVTVLHVAAATNNPDVVDTLLCQKRCQALLDAADLDGVTPVMTALQAASYGTLDQLCARGADLTKPLLTTGKTLLHLAALASDATAARIVLGYNSSPDFVNAVDHSGDTPLIEAVHLKSPVFDLLLEAGADITVCNPENGRTVLHVATAYNRDTMVERIVHHSSASSEFAEIMDGQGDSALMIAVKLQNLDNIHTLINTFSNLNGINIMQHLSVLHVAIANERCDILSELLHSTCPTSVNYLDAKHRPPMLYAAELDNADCLKTMIEFGVDFHVRNPDTGETLMHVVAKHQSHTTLPFLMRLHHISWFFDKKDFVGNTPYMAAICVGNDTFLREAFKVHKSEFRDYNSEGETFTYYTIRCGYPKLLHALLLSPRYYAFARRYQDELDLTDPEVILKAEVRGDIYATDVYILTKKVIKYPLVQWFPPNLLMKTTLHRNVFHACGLGGSLECLEFLYGFYQLFAPQQLQEDFDDLGLRGNSPCLMAAQCGFASNSCVHFFVTHGADISTTNEKGISVISSMLSYNCKADDLFISLFDDCVSAKKDHYYSDKTVIKVDFTILCPDGKNQMTIACLLYHLIKDDDMRRTILRHPVLVAFVKTKIRKLMNWIYYRFFFLCFMTLSISVLLPLLFIVESGPKEMWGLQIPVLLYCWFVLIEVVWMIHALFKLNNIFSDRLFFTDIVGLVPPFTLLPLVFYGKSFFFTPEFSALAILASWTRVITFSMNINSGFSHQISVFFRLVNNVTKQLIVLIAIIFAFSLSFFCIYHDNERFSDIANSFIYTFIVMLPGMMSDLPTFEKDYYSKTPITFHFFVECLVIALFSVIVVTAFINMLVGLAVRGGKFLEVDGQIYQNCYESHIINQIEYWCYSKFVKWVSTKCGFDFGERLRDHLKIEPVFDVFHENNKKICNEDMIHQFRSIVLKINELKPDESKEDMFEDISRNPSNTFPGASHEVESVGASDSQSKDTTSGQS